MRKKLTSDFEKKPVQTYYNFKTPEKPHPKVKVLEKGQKFIGSFQHTFVEDMPAEDGKVQQKKTHLIYDDTLGALTIPGCKSINDALLTVKRGTRVEIEFLGKGKKNPKKPMRKAPYLFEVWDISPDVAPVTGSNAEETDSGDESEEAEESRTEADDTEIEF